jgi:hypothetical protein
MSEVRVRLTDRGSDPLAFEVTVDDGSETLHEVSLTHRDLERLAHDDESPEEFIRRCFDFLLEREPKGSIMRRFDVSVISSYFPDFEDNIAR